MIFQKFIRFGQGMLPLVLHAICINCYLVLILLVLFCTLHLEETSGGRTNRQPGQGGKERLKLVFGMLISFTMMMMLVMMILIIMMMSYLGGMSVLLTAAVGVERQHWWTDHYGGHWWTLVDNGGHWWTLKDTGGHWWTLGDTD